jgi:hypothetical protein
MPLDRWRESGSDATPAARRLLESATLDDPSQAQLAELADRLGPMLRPSRPKVRIAPRVSGVGAFVARHALVVLVGGAAAVVGARSWTKSGTLSEDIQAPIIERSVDSPALLHLESVAEREPGRVSPEPSAAADPPAYRPADRPESEARLLLLAHEALVAGDSMACLTWVSEHQRTFPTGALAEERELLAIEALVKAGQEGRARARARAFHALYPSSAYTGRVDSALVPAHGAKTNQ